MFSWTGDAIRSSFLGFFESRGHQVLPSSSLIPDDPTVMLTFAGMLQFKSIFLGEVPSDYKRVTTCQKCFRTNDIDNVGRTTRHHTFFEMLGSFSFGDYFKREAIHWAWELATSVYELPGENIWVTVHEDDDEALSLWRDEVGVPEERIKKLGMEDNFWCCGETGLCGPCSEMFFDLHPEQGTKDACIGDGRRFLEFYNIVFMEFNRTENGDLRALPQKCIDTGLGLERMAQILQHVQNNYETDLIFPILSRAAELCGSHYHSSDHRVQTFLKVIGDHCRAAVYLVNDGVAPCNSGRGYVVRRLIRRIVRMGRVLDIRGDADGLFLPDLASIAIQMSINIDPAVKSCTGRIIDEIRREEFRFVQTLEVGERLLSQKLEETRVLPGKDVFMLSNMYGFPVELIHEVAEEKGARVDLEGFKAEMENQRQPRRARAVVKLLAECPDSRVLEVTATKFIGHEALEARDVVVLALLLKGAPCTEASAGEDIEVVLEQTPFYAAQGGQVGDNGVLVNEATGCKVIVSDVQRIRGDMIVHKGVVQQGKLFVGDVVTASVSSSLRNRVKAHHTATHLLQAALKQVLGNDTSQTGSLVTFDNLRFDFTFSRKVEEEEVGAVEELVNTWIRKAVPVQLQTISLIEARGTPMSGEIYGKEVRVVNVPGISMELCGGTHVSNTLEVQGFKIISLENVASRIGRITAVAGEAFIYHLLENDAVVKRLTCP